MSEALTKAFSPARLGQLELRNRLIKAATFEGLTPDGLPGDELLRFHKAVADGGVGMTTLAYCATEADGRINNQMLYMGDYCREPLRRIIAELKASGVRVSGQLGHCGGFSRNRHLEQYPRPMGPSWNLNLLGLPYGMPFSGAMSEREIEAFIDSFGAAAAFMKEVGFDAIEVHFGHGYGLSQFISPLTNRRNDRYGGGLNNRMRVPRRALESVRMAVGDDFPVLGKMSMSDGIRGGVGWEEGIEVAAYLDAAGIDALITSAGTSSFNPMLIFRGDSIVGGLIRYEKNPIARLGMALVGPIMFRRYPYQELYFLDAARRVRDSVDCQLVYIGGCSTLDSLETVMREGFDFVQMGRALIKDPDFVNQAVLDRGYDNGCTHCNRCAAMIESPGGVACPLI